MKTVQKLFNVESFRERMLILGFTDYRQNITFPETYAILNLVKIKTLFFCWTST
jgi:hypothetical protein